jgi:hypothetical protein
MIASFSSTRAVTALAAAQLHAVRPTSQFTFSVIGEISQSLFHQIAPCFMVEFPVFAFREAPGQPFTKNGCV